MVIQQFNKLIRNKWVWGVFAVAVSAAFCFDDFFTNRDREDRQSGDAGSLAGESVSAKDFQAIVDDVRGFGQQRDWRRKSSEVNRIAWENYAALSIADKDGIAATDAEVQAMIRRDPSFQQNGAFSFALYQRLLRENSLTPERFEESLKRRITLMRIGQSVLGSSIWTSSMELDRAVADMTDVLTVKVVNFSQSAADANKVTVDDVKLKEWYEKNIKALELPERIKVRYVKFDATDAKIQSKMMITDDELRDRYDVTVDKYTSTDTNGVETVKKFEEVKSEIEKELRLIASVNYYETNVNYRAYSTRAAKGSSRLDEIAKEDGLKVVTSDWFSIDGEYQEGFMRYASQICSGAKGFTEAVAELDSASEDLRYAVVSSESAVWLIEKSEVSAKHTPTFDEAKKAIYPRALKDAKAEAFKASVEAIAAKGAKAVAAMQGASTNITFSVADLRDGSSIVDNSMAVARASMKLNKGEVSEFTIVGPAKAILVVCEDRIAGDAAKAMALRSQIRDDLAMLQMRQLPEAWRKWNLDRLGFETGDISSVVDNSEEE